MKKIVTIFLQAGVVLAGIGALAFMLWEPTVEGRNAHATLFAMYFKDPFLACAYTASILFFAALYQAFKVLGYIRQGTAFSRTSVNAVRTIKYCAITLAALIVAAEAYLVTALRGKDDIAGGVAMGLFLIFAFVLIATAAAVFEKRLQRAV